MSETKLRGLAVPAGNVRWRQVFTEVFDFELQFGTMPGRSSLSEILQTHPRIDGVRLSVAYSTACTFHGRVVHVAGTCVCNITNVG